jgi:EmrB/QacA subfamily drug resistance transporter
MQSDFIEKYEFSRVKAPYLQLAIIILGVFMGILDTTIVNVAIPTMESAFGATTDDIQWVLTAYMLTLGVMIPISGWLTDKFGPKRLFLFSLAIFTVGSALCGIAWNIESMILFRIVQGIGGAFMQPVGMTMLFRIFPPERRGMVMGFFGLSIMVAPALGPVLSGYFIQYTTWRMIFYVNVPFGIFTLILGFIMLHEFSHQAKGRFDIWGMLFSTIGFASLLYGVNNISSDGWNSLSSSGFIVVGLLFLVVLVFTELNVKDPMIRFAVFKDYMFSSSLLLLSLCSVILFATIFFMPIYLQDFRGYNALQTGLFMSPAAVAAGIMMPISGKLFDKIGARPLGLVGLFIMAFSVYGFTSLSQSTSTFYVQLNLIFTQLGIGMVMMPVMTAGMNTIAQNLTSQANAMSNTIRQVAASFGLAILTLYLTNREKVHQSMLAWQVTPTSTRGHVLYSLQASLAGQGMSVEQAHKASVSMMSGLVTKISFIQAMADTFFVVVLLAVIAWVLMVFFSSKRERAVRHGSKVDTTFDSSHQKLLLD